MKKKRDNAIKTRDIWKTPIEEIFIRNGLKPIEIKKTGSFVMPARRLQQAAKLKNNQK